MTVRAELFGALGVEPLELAPLAGGAGRCEMWSLVASGRPLVYRRFPPGFDAVREREWQVLELVRGAGVPVPEPVAQTPRGIVVERVEGEARPRPLLGDDAWAHARSTLVARAAQAAARLHAIAPPGFLPVEAELDGGESARVDAAPAEIALASLERSLDAIGEPHPAIELGLRRLRRSLPAPAPAAVVHGDFRLSNLVVRPDGNVAVIDWELVHAGDGAEDLGWMCVRSWRFGSPLAALGCGSREELLEAYAAAGGRHVSLAELRWWETFGNARWAVICMLQAHRHLSGADPSLERATIGRRTCEAEWDLLELIADGRPAPSPLAAPQDAPDAGELLETVARYLRDDLRSRVAAPDAFKLAVAANALRIVARELAADFSPDDPSARERAVDLSAALRAGEHDERLDELVDPLRAHARARLAVAHPGWDAS